MSIRLLRERYGVSSMMDLNLIVRWTIVRRLRMLLTPFRPIVRRLWAGMAGIMDLLRVQIGQLNGMPSVGRINSIGITTVR